MMFPDRGAGSTSVDTVQQIDEVQGKLSRDITDQKLMHSVFENDRNTIEDGKLITEALNQGISSITPDIFFEKLVRNYSLAKQLYGERLIRLATGYDPDYVERNLKVPEFQRQLKNTVGAALRRFRKEGYLDKEGSLTERARELAMLTLYTEELDRITPKGFFGEKSVKQHSHYGVKASLRPFHKDRYRDIAVRSTVRRSVRRGHDAVQKEDLVAYDREQRGMSKVVYCLDASGSMRGEKLTQAKKAGIALAYKAIQEQDRVGLLVFSDEIEAKIEPTSDFPQLVRAITCIRAKQQTDIAKSMLEAVELFGDDHSSRHLILLTDAMPTVGEKQDTLKAASIAKAGNITISLVGFNLDKEGKALAQQITEIGQGKLYLLSQLDEVDRIILEDYYQSRN
ncbi:VWA domain-containing protein [Candidatus Woesearchaeota archaeon]|nr:VWA domain-containing protein [Candidatus Woesearchaeota archaeon]